MSKDDFFSFSFTRMGIVPYGSMLEHKSLLRFLRQIQKNKVRLRIEIVLCGFINNAQISFLSSSLIRQKLIVSLFPDLHSLCLRYRLQTLKLVVNAP